MQISVKLFAYFREDRFKIKEMEVGEDTTIGEIVDSLAIKRDEVGVLMVNSKHADFTYRFSDGDILAIFPLVGGG